MLTLADGLDQYEALESIDRAFLNVAMDDSTFSRVMAGMKCLAEARKAICDRMRPHLERAEGERMRFALHKGKVYAWDHSSNAPSLVTPENVSASTIAI
jgi:hypothetical protein